MKKLILLLAAFAFLNASAQKRQGGYFSLRGGMAFKDELNKGIGHLSIGVSPNHIFGVGGGIGFIEFDKPYIPLTVDISFFGKPGKISPVIIGSAGYGIYEYATSSTKVTGGFTGSLNAGISFPVKKYTKLFLTGGYAIYGFNGGENTATASDNYKAASNIKMLTITAGFKL